MAMTVQETREAILSMLGTANELEPRHYGPHPFPLDEYTPSGNYANAESVERGPEGDKFNWVAYSFYERDNYTNSQDVKAQLEQVFADNELCQNVHVTLHRDEDGLVHHVEYRFHTFSVEHSESSDGPVFCLSCGWNTLHLKCNAGPDDHPSENCHYFCANCGVDTGITTRCLRKITVDMEIQLEASLTSSPNVVSAVSPNVNSAVGEILISYALVENNLRALMVNVPGHNPRSNLSEDIERLKKYKTRIVASASAKSVDGGQAMEECIDAIVSAYAKIRDKRNALAHGQLVQVDLVAFSIGGDDVGREKDQGSRLQIEHAGETIELTEDGIQPLLDNARELQAHIGHLGQILELLVLQRRL